MKTPPIVSPQEWEAARQKMHEREKEVFRVRDELSAERHHAQSALGQRAGS